MPRNNVNPNRDYLLLQLDQFVAADNRADDAQDVLDQTILDRNKTLADNEARLFALEAEIDAQNAAAEQLVVDRTVDARVAEELATAARDWLVAVIREDIGGMVDPIADPTAPVEPVVVVTEPVQPVVDVPAVTPVVPDAPVAVDAPVAIEPVVVTEPVVIEPVAPVNFTATEN